ncbi:MAG: permease [Chitinispirillaceae bacterium]|nr:permease [Chitinispirillaceae bacterium]
MFEIIQRETVYFWFYFQVLMYQIAPYWIAGILIGSVVSVFGKKKMNSLVDGLRSRNLGILGILPASILGTISPLCMYGTIPIAASCANKGMREDWVAAFMMSSILLNPQLMVYTMALGKTVFIIRIVSCIVMGVLAGFLVYFFYKDKKFFNFSGFSPKDGHDVDPNLLMRLLKNIWRNTKTTGPYFFVGILLTVLFQRYVPKAAFVSLFGSNRSFGVLMAATLGVPLYLCGGGVVPLLRSWLELGMSIGGAAAFMLTGPSTKLTNLAALKSVLGIKNFMLYIIFSLAFASVTGLVCNLFF